MDEETTLKLKLLNKISKLKQVKIDVDKVIQQCNILGYKEIIEEAKEELEDYPIFFLI